MIISALAETELYSCNYILSAQCVFVAIESNQIRFCLNGDALRALSVWKSARGTDRC